MPRSKRSIKITPPQSHHPAPEAISLNVLGNPSLQTLYEQQAHLLAQQADLERKRGELRQQKSIPQQIITLYESSLPSPDTQQVERTEGEESSYIREDSYLKARSAVQALDEQLAENHSYLDRIKDQLEKLEQEKQEIDQATKTPTEANLVRNKIQKLKKEQMWAIIGATIFLLFTLFALIGGGIALSMAPVSPTVYDTAGHVLKVGGPTGILADLGLAGVLTGGTLVLFSIMAFVGSIFGYNEELHREEEHLNRLEQDLPPPHFDDPDLTKRANLSDVFDVSLKHVSPYSDEAEEAEEYSSSLPPHSEGEGERFSSDTAANRQTTRRT